MERVAFTSYLRKSLLRRKVKKTYRKRKWNGKRV